MVAKVALLGLIVFLLVREDGSTEENPLDGGVRRETDGELPGVKILYQWVPPKCERKVKSGDFVRYHYYGMLEGGTYFDSSHERGKTYNTYVESGWLIPGMDEALIGMCLNEHRIVTIPPHLAYGEDGTDDIPGGANVLFNFVLLDISTADDEVQITTTYKPSDCERTIENTDFVRYHYRGTLLNGQYFHSSYENNRTYDTYVGQGWLIKGMDIGVVGACMQEKRTITIPPHLAYGEKGDGQNIPPSASIRFEVEVVDFHNPKDDAVAITLDSKFGEVEEGKGDACPRRVQATDFVRYHYNGTLMDGTLFDSSYSRGETYDTYVGMRRLIAGMERGILGTCVGETRKVVIPPHLGYGERGVDDKIPGSAVLVFHIYLVDVHNPKDQVVTETLQEPPEDCERKVEVDDYITFDYELELLDGTKLGSSKEFGGSFGVYNGRGRIVLGLQRGVTGMCVGEIRKIIAPPHVGYGEPGEKGIPGSAVLVYTIEMLKIEDSIPEGALFMWKEGKSQPENLLHVVDDNGDGKVSVDELMSYILKEVDSGNAKILPGVEREKVVEDIFKLMDKDEDGFIQEKEMNIPSGVPDSFGVKMEDEL